ncbi:nucleotidyltransferase substrate binding protein [Bengtsoniella intestinalis]|uniref:nucleotidyltransferase substrate binding protein n=1 Tax=Bengtsoniella intestinalis TaxID=3073143 RepID=UPI00391F07DB
MKQMKLENFQKAVLRLAEGLDEYHAHPSTTARDGVIQRFEFTFELAWKSLKVYLQDQGVGADLQFPRQVLKEAYATKLIDDQTVWIDMLTARNTTSHIYDDRQATAVMADIENRYLTALQALSALYA